MGVVLGKASFDASVKPFVNLSSGAVRKLWQSFMLNADGWGVNPSLFLAIAESLKDDLPIENLAEAASALFKTMDTDTNDIVDGLELLATLSMISSMSPIEKMQFVFTCYDFDESGELTLDETTLSLKSTITGLCKISGNPIPSLADFEAIARLAFQSCDKDPTNRLVTITSEEFLAYVGSNPTSASWVSAYDDLEADEATLTTLSELTLTGTVLADASGAKNYSPPAPPTKYGEDAPFLATLEKSKPPPPPPPAEGEDPPPPPKPEATAPPNSSLSIEWIHGYSGSSRGNASYTASGSVIYPAATVGVIYAPADEENERPEPTQTYFLDSSSDITSLATSSDKKIAACGTSTGAVYLFDSATAATLSVCTSALPPSTAASSLSFSQDGKLLAVVGSDPDNTIVVLDVATFAPVFSAKTGKSPVLGISFSASNVDTLTVVSAGTNGVKPIVFWVKSKDFASTWFPKKGVFGASAPVPLTCVSSIGPAASESVVAGTLSGDLLVFSSRNLKLTIPGASTGPITSLDYSDGTLAVGGEDGSVKTFSVSPTLEVKETASMDLRATGNVFLVADIAVSSVALSAGKVLVGTRGNELLELSLVGTPAEEGAEEGAPLPFPQVGDVLNGGPVTSGHGTYNGVSATSLATNASTAEYATVGTDNKLFVWDAASHKQVKSLSLDSAPSTVAYSADGGLIAVGYADGPKKGSVAVFGASAEDPAQLEIKGSGNESLGGAAITAVKFGAAYIAAATETGEIFLYNLEADAETKAFPLNTKIVVSETAEAIKQMDISTTGTEIIVNLEDEVVYLQKPEGEDTEWGKCTPFVSTEEKPGPEISTFTNTLYAGLQGLYGDNGSGSYTAVAKPKVVESVVAAADSTGVISLFPYPTSKYGAAWPSTFVAHSSSAGGLCDLGFTSEDALLVSAGKGDGCIIQWSFGPDEGYDSALDAEAEAAAAPPAEEEPEEEEEEKKIEVDSCDDEDLIDKLEIDVDEFIVEGGGFDAVDAFKASLMPADAASVVPSRDLPAEDLSLRWIHGVSSNSTRNSVVYNDAGSIVYPAGSAVVVLDKAAGKQSHFLGHTDAVSCLTLARGGVLCATGQVGKSPKAIVWDTTNVATKKAFELGESSTGISAIAFSNDGELLAVASQDAAHTVYVYAWKSGALKCSSKTGERKVLCLSFNGDGSGLVAGGDKTFSVFTIAGKNMSMKSGQFGSALGGRKVITCAAWVGGDYALGTAAGKLYRLEGGRKLAGEAEVFEKGHVNCLTVLPAPADPEASGYPAVIVGGEMGVVKILDEALGELKSFDLWSMAGASKSKVVRAATLNKDTRKLLVATKGSEIYEFSNPAGGGDEEELPANINDGALVVGHSKDQLWGVAAHPVKNEIATCGDDKNVVLWDLDGNKVVRSIAVGDFARSCDYSPNGHLLAVGLGGVRGGGAAGAWEAPAAEVVVETEVEVGGEEKKEEEQPPTDPWLLALWKKGIKPREKEGAVLVVSLLEDEIRIVSTNQDASGYISDIKFSPDGNKLAAASMDGSVYLYNCLKDFVLIGKSEGDGSPICHLDWNADSSVVMVNTIRKNDAAVKFYSADGSTVDGDDERVMESSWNTWTCTLGRTVKGCFPSGGKDLSVVNAVSRSSGAKLVAAGDVNGGLKLLKYPSLEAGAAFKDFAGHSSGGGVGNVVFSKSDDFLVSVGVGDRCVMVWDVLVDDADDDGDKEYGLSDDSDYAAMAPVDEEEVTVTTAGEEDGGEGGEEKKEESAPVELTWREKFSGASEAAPEAGDYELSCVYGANAKAGLGYSGSGDAVYSCGGASVVYKGGEKSFRVFSGAGGAVRGMACSQDGRFGLAGDALGGVSVFDTSSGSLVAGLAGPGAAGGGVGCVAWSADGRMCATVGSGGDHVLSVYRSASGNWGDGALYARSNNVSAAVSFACFTEGGDGPDLVTGGYNHAMFWTLRNGNISSRSGRFGKEGGVQPLTCGASLKAGVVVTGTVGGSVMEWDVKECKVVKKTIAHTQCVTSISKIPGGGGVVTSGKDGFVKIFDGSMASVNSFEVGGVCLAAAVDCRGSKLLAGLSSGSLKEIVVDSGYAGVLVEGSRGSWGKGDKGAKVPGSGRVLSSAAACPGGVVAGGADGFVRKWSSGGGALPCAVHSVGSAVGAVAVGAGGVVAVGCGSGVGGDSDVRTVEGAVVFLDSDLKGIARAQKDDGGGYVRCLQFGGGDLVYAGMSGGSVEAFDAR
ncbi:hypothetical protein TrRE_jg9544, partial [Triparma retinervis]